MQSNILYSSFDWLSSVTVTGLGVIGGLGYAAGPDFGASLQPGAVGTNIGDLFGSNVQTYLLLAGGLILILVLLQAPDGIAPNARRDLDRLRDLVWRLARVRRASEGTSFDNSGEPYAGARRRAWCCADEALRRDVCRGYNGAVWRRYRRRRSVAVREGRRGSGASSVRTARERPR